MSGIENRDTRASDAVSGQRPAATPYWLLWSVGVAGVVLCIAAFVLWGVAGATTLFDMIVALCS